MDSIHILTCHDPSSYNSKVVARKEKSHLEKNTLETVFMTQYSSKCMDLSEKNVTSQCMWLDYELNSDNNNNNNNNNGSTGGGGGGGGDNNDDDNTKNKNTKNIQGIYDKKPSTSHRTQQYQGIWPWFGYNPSNTSKESSSKDNINSQTESLTEANEHNKCHDSTETNDSDKHPYSSHSYPSLDRENDEQNTKDKRSVSSNKEKNSQEDAVIIESTSVHRVEEQHTKIDAAKNKIKAKLRLNPASLSDNHTSTDTLYDQQESAEMSESVQEETIATVHRKPNIVLPSFQSQFHSTPPPLPPPVTTEPKNVLRKALNIVHSLFSGTHPTSKETTLITENPFSGLVNKMKLDPKDMSGKRIVVVGVHGWFPMKLVRSMIGEPTGTSDKFCEQMTMAAKHFFQSEYQLLLPDHAITTIPLQGEGKVEERVNKLFNSLVNNPAWMSALVSADVVLWATHSQGTPVSTILIHRLLEKGFIHRHRQAVCLLAMAGIGHGPFPALKGSLMVKYFEADAARELFEFMDSNSSVSQTFRHSLAYILHQGVKTTLVGSMQDQVVPFYSAILAGVNHPNILRAAYIDHHIYSPNDFLINAISFALRLRNSGLSDHGFLTHISEVLAGNIYALEGGHSTVYEELEVYTIAVRYLFETVPLGEQELIYRSTSAMATQQERHASVPSVEAKLDPFQAKVRLNPYYLPWAMRGIFDDENILKDPELSRELENLRALYDRWHPSSSKLREIKFRLEPLKAKL